jgi:predicted phosphodiesterase
MLVRQIATANQDVAYRHRETFSALSVDERDFMRTWPSQLSVSHEHCTLLLVHGSPKNQLGGYVYPNSSLSEFSAVSADVVFMGHTHHPFVRHYNEKLFVNVGSCGLPRGEDLRGSVCIFDLLERSAKIRRFDISDSCSRILSRYSFSPPVTSLLERCSSYKIGKDLEE